jgi:N-acyl-L-homoserine lactone synthetase
MKKEAGSDYLKIAKNLDDEESERVLSRMTGKLPRRFDKDKLTKTEAIAIQLEIEEEQLEEWREKMEKIRKKDID